MNLKTKKIIPYLLALIILAGFLGFVAKTHAQTATTGSSSTSSSSTGETGLLITDQEATAGLKTESAQSTTSELSTLNSTTATSTTAASTTAASTTKTPDNSNFYDTVLKTSDYACSGTSVSAQGCFAQVLYFLLMLIPSWILWLSAQFFNVFAFITLNGSLFSSATFISTAWGVTRDLSNIFFILILLYAAIQLILGIHGADVKRMIGKVVIMALLINFSMFFTEVVIDSSNILALIFYNKITVGTTTKDSTGKVTITKAYYDSVTGEKDVAGGLTGAFNPANQLNAKFFESAEKLSVPGSTTTTPGQISLGIILGIMFLSGGVMLFAAYAFFVAAFCFLGRMIELFTLIIFSPFAFMSFTVPKLAGIEDLGWDSWLKRLLTASFMAPVFMFFMYFIFMLVGSGLFNSFLTTTTSNGTKGFTLKVLGIFLPAMLILVLLLKATKLAKKGSGKFGEMVMTGAKLVGGLAVGAATGMTALAGTKLIGGAAQKTLNDDNLRAQAAGDKEHFAKMGILDPKKQQEMQRAAQRRLASATKTANRSYDFRQTGIGKFAAKQTGMNINRSFFGVKAMSTEQLKGGAAASYKRKVEKNEAIRKSYEMTPAAAEKYDEQEKGKFALRKAQYEADFKTAKERPRGSAEKAFDEKQFKSDYEAGKYMSIGDKTVKVEAGSLEKARTSKDVNDDRRKAQAWSIDHPTSGQDENGKEIKAGFRDFGRLFKEGMIEMGNSKGGLVKTTAMMAGGVALAPLTGGVSLVAAPFVGGALHALKTIIKAKALDVPQIHKLAIDPNLAATLRKGTSASQKIVDILKEVEGGDKKVEQEIKNAVKPTPTIPTAHSTVNSNPTSSSGHTPSH